ncbi:hypothetical protein CDL15_Pgr024704 [Punica granatum]|uniref:Uncharacterized protein n=1 Tax=Punica granatum TaxID=22663 RepID=A0A218W521_PUNGR|nr:hypothetical protein CDL15_Pgr024704 [Punica granatum]
MHASLFSFMSLWPTKLSIMRNSSNYDDVQIPYRRLQLSSITKSAWNEATKAGSEPPKIHLRFSLPHRESSLSPLLALTTTIWPSICRLQRAVDFCHGRPESRENSVHVADTKLNMRVCRWAALVPTSRHKVPEYVSAGDVVDGSGAEWAHLQKNQSDA